MIRNFYVESDIDGRESRLASGPANREGGMYTTHYVRDMKPSKEDGKLRPEIEEFITVKGTAKSDGVLRYEVFHEGHCILSKTFARDAKAYAEIQEHPPVEIDKQSYSEYLASELCRANDTILKLEKELDSLRRDYNALLGGESL